MSIRPITTLFLLISVDGKISTGDTNGMDVDKDYPRIKGVREGLKQYYDLERRTDLFSLNSGKVFEKIGVNKKEWKGKKLPVSFIVIDNKPHLNKKGTAYLCNKSKKVFIITNNKNHPSFQLKKGYKNLEVLFYKKPPFSKVFRTLKKKYAIPKITIQTGGTLNSVLLREGLIDHISVVVAPVLVGGKDTQSLIGGESLHEEKDLFKIKALKLKKFKKLKNSYLHLTYDVLN